MSGEVVHFEIPAENVARARRFYEKTFGWQMQPVPEMEYTMVATGPSDKNGMPKRPGAINGGMMRRDGPVKHPVVTIHVDDIDASATSIEKNGGKVVVPKQSIGEYGWSAYFTDPEGNLLGLFQRPRG